MRQSRFSSAPADGGLAAPPPIPVALPAAAPPPPRRKRAFEDVTSAPAPAPAAVPAPAAAAMPPAAPPPPPPPLPPQSPSPPPVRGKWGDVELPEPGEMAASSSAPKPGTLKRPRAEAVPPRAQALLLPARGGIISGAARRRPVFLEEEEMEEGAVGAGRGGARAQAASSALAPPALLAPPAVAPAALPDTNTLDALDAFMNELPAAVAPLRATVVSLEDVLAGGAAAAASGGGDGGGGEGVDAEEEAYRAAFLRALGAGGGDERDGDGGGAGAGAPAAATTEAAPGGAPGAAAAATAAATDDDDAALYAGEEWGEEKSALDILREKAAKRALPELDHAAVAYLPFEKGFYRPHADVAVLSTERVAALREDLEVKLRGREPIPAPVATWEHTGLPDRILGLLAARGYAAPFAVQQQALPIIMSGRDLLGVARTGSGKTLAYLLPLLRQILDQPPLREGEGPIGLVLAPSRELVVQVRWRAPPPPSPS
jgi:ATP-dependent RNA helicase DDX46/PRP5